MNYVQSCRRAAVLGAECWSAGVQELRVQMAHGAVKVKQPILAADALRTPRYESRVHAYGI